MNTFLRSTNVYWDTVGKAFSCSAYGKTLTEEKILPVVTQQPAAASRGDGASGRENHNQYGYSQQQLPDPAPTSLWQVLISSNIQINRVSHVILISNFELIYSF